MQRGDVVELHYITPISNLDSVFDIGLLSNHKAKYIEHRSIADSDVQRRRAIKVVPGGLRLHRYVNLYFNAHNPMLFIRRPVHATIAVLAIHPDVIDYPGVFITDGNAASRATSFYRPDQAGFEALANYDFHAQYWTKEAMSPQDREEASRMRCAEVLVPNHIHKSLITRVYCSTDETRAEVVSNGCTIEVVTDEQLFFHSNRRW